MSTLTNKSCIYYIKLLLVYTIYIYIYIYTVITTIPAACSIYTSTCIKYTDYCV